MTFSPKAGGLVFGLVVAGIQLLVIFFLLTDDLAQEYIGVSKLWLSVTVALVALSFAVAFSFGARRAAYPHSVRSIITACAVMYGASSGLNKLEDVQWLGGQYAFVTVLLLKVALAYVFGWRLAPMHRAPLHTPEGADKKRRKTARILFESQNVKAATSLRTQLLVAMPKNCKVGKIRGVHSGNQSWFEIDYYSSDEPVFRNLLGDSEEFSIAGTQESERTPENSQQVVAADTSSARDG